MVIEVIKNALLELFHLFLFLAIPLFSILEKISESEFLSPPPFFLRTSIIKEHFIVSLLIFLTNRENEQ